MLIFLLFLFTPGLLTILFNGPLKLERLAWGGDPKTMPTGIDFSLRIGRKGFILHVGGAKTQGTSVILSPDPQGLYFLSFVYFIYFAWNFINQSCKHLFLLQVEFVVYDMATSQVMMSVDCGGGHRNWDIKQHGNDLLFAYIREKKTQLVCKSIRPACHMIKVSFISVVMLSWYTVGLHINI